MRELKFSPLEYLDVLYRRTKPELSFRAKTRREFLAWQRKLRKRLILAMGGLPEGKVSLNPQVLSVEERDGYRMEKVVFRAEKEMDVPAYLLIPHGTKEDRSNRAVIAFHGHGRGKSDVVGIALEEDDEERIERSNYAYAHLLAQRGYVVLAPDQRCFGEREFGGCQKAQMNALLLGRTLIGMRVWDAIRCVDYLETRKEVNPERIGVLGVSGGGTTSLFTSAIERRIKVTVVSGYFCTFKDSIFDLRHCACNYIPGIVKIAEEADIGGLIAPRPLFIENGVDDPIFPACGVERAYRALRRIYKVAGAGEALGKESFDGGHQFYGRRAFDWLDKWL